MNSRRIVKRYIPKSIFSTIEPYGHLLEAVALNLKHGMPSRGLQVIGVTGTNGKTTTCFLLHRMLQDAGYKVGLMTTVSYGIGEDIKPQLYHMTTVSTPQLLRRLKTMKEAGCDWVILETTSHALAQHRVWGVPYSIAVLTNITHEHLAYHRTFERYRNAKRMLFKMTNRNKHGLQIGIVNADDPSADLFASDIKRPLSYGIKSGDIQAVDVHLSPQAVDYSTSIEGQNYNIHCQIPGSFNVYNSLAAVCVGHVLGLSHTQIESGIAALAGVEGRMTRIEEGQDFEVIVDYAHSPDSFEKLFQDVRPIISQRIICVFGSLGGGDTVKRPLQGEIAGRFADVVIICEEDDRLEDGEAIMKQIASGAVTAGKIEQKNLHLIHDRTEAIAFAIQSAQTGDMVLLLGKGHEKTIEHADGEHPWNEIGTAREVLRQRMSEPTPHAGNDGHSVDAD